MHIFMQQSVIKKIYLLLYIVYVFNKINFLKTKNETLFIIIN